MPTIVFEGSDEPIDSWELEHFLGLFRVVYSHALAITATPEAVVTTPDVFVRQFKLALPLPNADEQQAFITNIRATDYEAEELRINRILKNSPLEIAFIGVLSALTIAVIFSGGKVELRNLKDLKFTLPPLGVGVKNLRESLRFGPQTRIKRSDRTKNH